MKTQAKLLQISKFFSEFPFSVFGYLMREQDSTQLARLILEANGFKNIEFIGKPYDFKAEKDGIKYGIEIKGSDISFTTTWHQIECLYRDYFLMGNKVLLMFITEDGSLLHI